MTTFKRNVFILGAGFSKPANAPLMNEFFDALQACYFLKANALAPSDKVAFEFVMKFRQDIAKVSDVFDVNLDNLEQLFGLLEMQVAAGVRDAQDRHHFVWALLRSLEMVIEGPNHHVRSETVTQVNAISHSLGRLNSLRIGNPNWLYYAFGTHLARSHFDMNGLKDVVITFNYDLLLDRALCDLGFQVEYGLGLDHSYSSKYHEVTASFTPTTIPIFKVHGSANWIRCECPKHDVKRLFIAPPRGAATAILESLLEQSVKQCPACNKLGHALCSDQEKVHTPLIVPPTWNKAGYQSQVQPVWISAIKALQEAQRIIVIGFSLPETDLFFRYMLMAGVQIGKGVEFWLYDPDERVFERYRAFLARQYQQFRFFPRKVPFGSVGFQTMLSDLQ